MHSQELKVKLSFTEGHVVTISCRPVPEDIRFSTCSDEASLSTPCESCSFLADVETLLWLLQLVVSGEPSLGHVFGLAYNDRPGCDVLFYGTCFIKLIEVAR